ncbi:DUF732 domain-containing protein [Mycolicibacterium llatzerense]|uniref:DUF732 domain-containing protein n=1 Tax=Mycolicibacterium llatzerense TaxID=280871 RepID=UPI00361520FA
MSRVRVGLIAAGIVTVAAALVGAVLYVGQSRHEAVAPVGAPSPTQTTVAAPSLAPPTITTVIVSPPPVTQTIAAVPPTRTLSGPIPDLVPYNDEFLAAIQRNGWTIWDRTMMLRRAHEACGMLRGGESSPLIAQKLLGVEPQLTPQMATQFVSTVSAVYPCF